MIGTKLLERYELIEEIGRGGMGVVYRARDGVLGREVAIKMLPLGFIKPENKERFRREAEVLAAMDHSAIVAIHDFGYHGESLFLVMPFIPGGTLRDLLREDSLSLGEVLRVAIEVANALDHSHSGKVIHCDIKPENVMVDRERDVLRVRVTDFGMARASAITSLTQSSSGGGTPHYMSPEQIRGADLDNRTDLYSLGVVLYECLAGKRPFEGSVESLVKLIPENEPESLRVRARARGLNVPSELERVVMACLAKEPSARPPTGRKLAKDLRRCAAHLPEDESTQPLTRRGKPAVRAATSEMILVGRKDETDRLRERLDAALAGECQLVLIAGEVGVGKSRLLEELATLAQARGIRVLRGRFADRQKGLPYQGFCELIHEYFRDLERNGSTSAVADLSDLAPQLLAHLSVLSEIPGLRSTSSSDSTALVRQPPSSDNPRPDESIFVRDLIARTLTRIGGGEPLVLLLENLHAGDVSVEALDYLVPRLGPTPTLISGAYRPTEIDRTHPLRQRLDSSRDDPKCCHVELGPLSRAEVRQLVEYQLDGGDIDEDSLAKLYEASEGNPLFILALVDWLCKSSDLRREGSGKWVLDDRVRLTGDTLPPTIQQVIKKRLDLLSERQRKVLSEAAVLGRSFDYDDFEAITGFSELDEVVETLEAEGLIKEEGKARGNRWSFTSGVMHDVLFHQLPRRKRRLLHREYAYRLEMRYAGRLERILPQLVHHFSEGEVPAKTVTHGLAFARSSLTAKNLEEAIRASQTALEFVDDEEIEKPLQARGELLLVIAQAECEARHLDSALRNAEHAVAALEEFGDFAAAADAALLAAQTARQAQQGEETRCWVERGIELARSCHAQATLKQLLTLGAEVAYLRGEHRESKLFHAEAKRLASEENVRDEPVPEGGTLVTALPAAISSLDPATLMADEEIEIAANVFETLLAPGPGHPVTGLASDWTISADHRTVMVMLDSDVRFSDGSSLRASDAKASFERLARLSKTGQAALAGLKGMNEFLAGKADGVSGIEVTDNQKLVFHLSEPLPIFPALLTKPQTALVHEVTGRDGPVLIGTGPFRIAETTAGVIVLERNRNYWRGLPAHLDRIEYRTSVDALTIAEGLRAGEIDLGRDLSPEDLEELLRDRGFRSGLVEATKKGVYFVLFNCSGPVTGRAEVRRALARVVRTQDLVWRTLGRFAQPAVSLIPPEIFGHDPGRRRAQLTREKASELVHNSGLQSPACLRAAVHPMLQDRYKELTLSLRHEWEALGFEIKITNSPSSMKEFRLAYQDNQEIDLLLGRWIADYDDPDDFTYGFFHSRDGRFCRYFASTEADDLMVQARHERKPARRAQLYHKLEELLDRDDALLPLFHDVHYRIAGPQVRALRLTSSPPFVSYTTVGKTATEPGPEVTGALRSRGEIRVPVAGAVESLDPTYATLAEYLEVIPNVFETLTRVEEGAEIKYLLAEKCETQADGLRYRILLRQGVRFHDGRRLTARDVRYSFERLIRKTRGDIHFALLPIRGAQELRERTASELAGLRILSETELEIELDQRISFFPVLLSCPLAAIVPEGCEKFAGDWRSGCAGTGPFRVVRFKAGERLELEANPDYWNIGYPKSNRLVFRFGLSPEQILKEFRQGRLTLASDLRPRDIEELRRDPDFAEGYTEASGLITYFLIPDRRHGPFANLGLRRAFARRLDIAEPVTEAGGPVVTLARGIIPPRLFDYKMDEPSLNSLSAGAEPLCDVSLRAIHPPFFGKQYGRFWQCLCHAVRATGAAIESESYSVDELMPLARDGEADLIGFRWGADYADPHGFIGTLLHSSEGSLHELFRSQEIDRLIEQGRSETNPALRRAKYREITELLHREALLIPLFHEQIYRFCHHSVCGFRFGMSRPEVRYEELYLKR